MVRARTHTATASSSAAPPDQENANPREHEPAEFPRSGNLLDRGGPKWDQRRFLVQLIKQQDFELTRSGMLLQVDEDIATHLRELLRRRRQVARDL